MRRRRELFKQNRIAEQSLLDFAVLLNENSCIREPLEVTLMYFHGTNLVSDEQAPEGVPSAIAPERLEEFAPGLDPALLELIQATADMEMAEVNALFGPVVPDSKGSAS